MTELKTLPNNIIVLHGNHSDCDPLDNKSGCVMNLVAWVCGYEEITDTPPCASEVLARYAIRLNDRIGSDNLRTELMLPLVYKLAGSKSTREVELKRLYFLVDKTVRVFAPLVLEAEGHKEQATKLRNLPEIVDKQTALEVKTAAYDAYAAHDTAYVDVYAAAAAAYVDVYADAAYAAATAAYADAAKVYRQASKFLEQACEITA